MTFEDKGTSGTEYSYQITLFFPRTPYRVDVYIGSNDVIYDGLQSTEDQMFQFLRRRLIEEHNKRNPYQQVNDDEGVVLFYRIVGNKNKVEK